MDGSSSLAGKGRALAAGAKPFPPLIESLDLKKEECYGRIIIRGREGVERSPGAKPIPPEMKKYIWKKRC